MNPFAALGGGYAQSRPPVHPLVIERMRVRFNHRWFRKALDVGCGSGLSTRPLALLAQEVVGLEPGVEMLAWTPASAPGARFVAASAESLPFRVAAFDLITAAGALNYVNLDRFFPEAARVLSPSGILAVYDFSPGRSFPESGALDTWFGEFTCRYPWPPAEARELNPSILTEIALGFHLDGRDDFEIPLTLSPQFYLDYMMTETNVAFAERRGIPHEEIQDWCAQTLRPVFADQPRTVLFRGYIAYLVPA